MSISPKLSRKAGSPRRWKIQVEGTHVTGNPRNVYLRCFRLELGPKSGCTSSSTRPPTPNCSSRSRPLRPLFQIVTYVKVTSSFAALSSDHPASSSLIELGHHGAQK